MKKTLMLLTITLMPLVSFADNWIYVPAKAKLSCPKNKWAAGGLYEVLAEQNGKNTTIYSKHYGFNQEKMISLCTAAMYQSEQDNKGFYVRIEDGLVVAEDGYFHRENAKKESVPLQSPSSDME